MSASTGTYKPVEEVKPVLTTHKPTGQDIVKAPIVGIFYTSPGPGEAPFVRAGQKIKKGDPIGIIEAMKVMNEIVATKDGIVQTIFVKDKDYVEYNQPLIEIV